MSSCRRRFTVRRRSTVAAPAAERQQPASRGSAPRGSRPAGLDAEGFCSRSRSAQLRRRGCRLPARHAAHCRPMSGGDGALAPRHRGLTHLDRSQPTVAAGSGGRRCASRKEADAMETYRVVWLSCLRPLGRDRRSRGPRGVTGGRGVLVRRLRGRRQPADDLPCRAYWERGTRGRLRLLAGGALVAGTSVGAFVGYASLLGPGVLLLAAVVLAGSPYAVKASGRWLRSVRTPSTAQLDAVARAFAYANPEFVQFRRRSCATSPMSSSANGGEPATGHPSDNSPQR